ncbi:MAG: polyphosphate polymerase domain-containing protein [Chloroflexi bacterium]|nr:polyphosphate polymerase domain-containing protein [Chloroflexota bacterium]
MVTNRQYRTELKYSIDYADYLALRQRLCPIMKRDAHVRDDGHYIIRSIYFDNFNDKAIREKVDGVARREKFRIRYYNDDYSYIKLEKKVKLNNLCVKLGAPLTENEYRMLLGGKLDWMLSHPAPLVREFYIKIKGLQLRPRVRVSYTREPFIYAPGNVRVTFDSDIRTTLWHKEFLEPHVSDISATGTLGQMILEVKYDGFLPEIIQDLLQTERVRQQAFSKYRACRRFG